jgi:hypothetical protein
VRSSHHAAHAAHTAHASHVATASLWLWNVNDHSLGGDHEGCDPGSIDECSADNLGWVDDTGFLHVNVLSLGCVEATAFIATLEELVNDDGSLEACVLANSLAWNFASALYDANANVLVEVSALKRIKPFGGEEEGRSSTNDDALIGSGSGGTESILDSILELTNLNLGGTADLDDGDSTSKSSSSLLELLLVVLASGVLHLAVDSLDTIIDICLLARATHDNGVVLGDDNLLGRAEHAQVSAVKGLANILGEESGTSGHGDVLHGVASVVTESWGLDSSDLEASTELVHDEGGEGLALNVLSNDEEWLLLLHAALKEWEDLLDRADLLVNQEDATVGELNLLAFGLSHEVWRHVSTVPSESFNVLNLSLETLALSDSDSSVGTELLEDTGDQATDVSITVSGDSGDVHDLILALDGDRLLLESVDDLFDGHLDTSAEVHWVHASGNRFAALLEDGTGEDGRRGSSITSLVVGLAGNLLDKIGTDVVVAVAELNVLGNSNTVLGNLWHSKSSVEDNITAAWSESDLDGVCEHLASLQHEGTGFSSELDVLASEVESLSGDQLRLGLLQGQRSSGKGASDNGLHLIVKG